MKVNTIKALSSRSNVQFEYDFPLNWKEIEPKQYSQFFINSTSDLPCLNAFISKEGSVISVYNYGEKGDEFLESLAEQMKELDIGQKEFLNEVDKEISSRGEKIHTQSIKVIAFKKIKLAKNEALCNVLNIKTQEAVSTSYQFFVKSHGFLLGILTQSLQIKANEFPEEVLKTYPHIREILEILIPSIK